MPLHLIAHLLIKCSSSLKFCTWCRRLHNAHPTGQAFWHLVIWHTVITSHREPRSMVPRKASALREKLSSWITIVSALRCIRFIVVAHAHSASRCFARRAYYNNFTLLASDPPDEGQVKYYINLLLPAQKLRTFPLKAILLTERGSSETQCARLSVPNSFLSPPSHSRPSSRSAQRR